MTFTDDTVADKKVRAIAGLALELANVSAELVTVARAVASGPGEPDEWGRGFLNNHANDVAALVERVREANDTPATVFDEWRNNLPAMSAHITTPERTAEVVRWLVAVCGWDGVADAMANHAGDLLEGCPELLLECGGRDALLSVLRLAQHLTEATT
jgi:hypothetical protein